MSALLLAAVLAAAPLSAGQWRLDVGGVPSGLVTVQVGPGQVTYSSRLFFRGRERLRTVQLAVDAAGRTADGRWPQTAWLAHGPGAGCADTVEELTGRTERVCLSADGRTGTLDGKALMVQRSAAGQLEVLTLGPARLVATPGPVIPPDEDAFAKGFPVDGLGEVPTLAPSIRGLRTPTVAAIAEEQPDANECLPAAKAWAKHTGGEVVLGVVLEDGRAWPHAWGREAGAGRDVDPSVVKGDAEMAQRRYLAFPNGEAGRLYLELLAGTRTVRLGSARR